jgi:hypothetical protein
MFKRAGSAVQPAFILQKQILSLRFIVLVCNVVSPKNIAFNLNATECCGQVVSVVLHILDIQGSELGPEICYPAQSF